MLFIFLINVFLSLSTLPDALPRPKLSVDLYGPVSKLYVRDKENVKISCSIDSAYLKSKDYVNYHIHTFAITLNCFVITFQMMFLVHRQQMSFKQFFFLFRGT